MSPTCVHKNFYFAFFPDSLTIKGSTKPPVSTTLQGQSWQLGDETWSLNIFFGNLESRLAFAMARDRRFEFSLKALH